MANHAQLTARDIHGPYVQLLTNLQGDNGREWLDALNRFLRKENPWEKSKLLETLTSFQFPGAKEFITKENYCINAPGASRVNIEFLGYYFERTMLAKIERKIKSSELKLMKLTHTSTHALIICEMGGLDKGEVTLCELCEALAYKQSHYNKTRLFAYIRDADGAFWAVEAHWGESNGWRIGSQTLQDEGPWTEGCEFLTH